MQLNNVVKSQLAISSRCPHTTQITGEQAEILEAVGASNVGLYDLLWLDSVILVSE